MCGIAGYLGSAPLGRDRIENTVEALRTRGPDYQAHNAISLCGLNANLIHTRLSIIDLDPRSNQPFSKNGCHLVFNGELYNYLELKAELQKLGVEFRTSSDTEVLLESYLRYGPGCTKRFEGMWAFAIIDTRKQLLFLSRDRFGEKPLYYTNTAGGFYFASEVSALEELSGCRFSINYDQIKRYLVNGYKSLYKNNDFFFNDLKELPRATNFTIKGDLAPDMYSYWQPLTQTIDQSLDDCISKTRSLLLNSVKLRLRADVPLAFCLSGGLDSTTIVSIAAKEFGADVQTFSIIDQDERYNEYDNILATVKDLNCKNRQVHLTKEPTLDRLDELIRAHDSPLATISYYVHASLSQAIAQEGYKVVFSGTAADELFTGYYDHYLLHLEEVRSHTDYQTWLRDWQRHVKPMTRNPHLQNPEIYKQDPLFSSHIYLNSEQFSEFLTEPFKEPYQASNYSQSPLRNRMLNELFHEVIPVILHEDDLNSMHYSIENRSPFLDTQLFEHAFSIPSAYLIGEGYGKYVLRRAVAGIVNDQVRLDRRKKGFNAAFHSVFDLNAPEVKDRLFADSEFFQLVKRTAFEELIQRENLPNSYSKFLFNLVNIKLFLDWRG